MNTNMRNNGITDSDKIKNAFANMSVSTEYMTEKVKEGIEGKSRPARARKPRVAILICVAVLATVLLAQGAVVFAKEIVVPWVKTITAGDKQIEIKGSYLSINQDACTKEAKYDTIADVEKMLGVDLLRSSETYEGKKGMIMYTPYTDDNKMMGAMLIDHQYALGDLKDVKIDGYADDVSLNPSMECRPGKEYKSAISAEIKIRSDVVPSKKYQNSELEYDPQDWDLPKDTKIKTYKNKLKVPMLICNTEMDWGPNQSAGSIDKMQPATIAKFAYKGVEYTYYGIVSANTMKKFLDTLF